MFCGSSIDLNSLPCPRYDVLLLSASLLIHRSDQRCALEQRGPIESIYCERVPRTGKTRNNCLLNEVFILNIDSTSSLSVP